MKYKNERSTTQSSKWLVNLLLLLAFSGCSTNSEVLEEINEEGEFLVYRRQSLIGKETYTVTADKTSITVKSFQGENERGRISGVQSEMQLNSNFSPTAYFSRRIVKDDTTSIFKMELGVDSVSIWEKHFDVVTKETPREFFPLHSNIPAAMEMMLYRYYFKQDGANNIPTLPRGEVSITHKGQDIAQIDGKAIPLDRYVVEGINWGGRTVWLDADKNLVALVKANTQIREIIKKGYEDAMPLFIAGNVKEQIAQLSDYTESVKGEAAEVIALVGGDLVDGISDITQQDMTLLIEKGRITAIGKHGAVGIPQNAKVIDLTGKTLMPGLWDMHAHSNQVQWPPPIWQEASRPLETTETKWNLPLLSGTELPMMVY